MNLDKIKALEAAGFRMGDAEDFLGLTTEEVQLVNQRMENLPGSHLELFLQTLDTIGVYYHTIKNKNTHIVYLCEEWDTLEKPLSTINPLYLLMGKA